MAAATPPPSNDSILPSVTDIVNTFFCFVNNLVSEAIACQSVRIS